LILTTRCFNLLQLDNKKLEALPKGKDRSPVMQVGTLVLGIGTGVQFAFLIM
jgi:hypothetical protein